MNPHCEDTLLILTLYLEIIHMLRNHRESANTKRKYPCFSLIAAAQSTITI